MTLGSLFSGIGGIDLGFQRAGFTVKWQVEIDPYCRRVLAKHWPDVRRHDDVRTLPDFREKCRCGGERIIEIHEHVRLGGLDEWRVDCIAGGPPCQRTSVAAAIQGVRTGFTLWPNMRDIIDRLRPAWAVIEQPPGNRAWNAAVAGDLAGIGYHHSRLELSARRSGAPHERRRVFFVANAVRERCEAVAGLARSSSPPAQPWPSPPGGTWRTAGAGNRGVDNGFSDWVDRLKGLGNAVVPDVAESIARWILAAQSSNTTEGDNRQAA